MNKQPRTNQRRHSFNKKLKISQKKYKNAENYYREAITWPWYFDLKKSVQLKIIKIINTTLSKNFLL